MRRETPRLFYNAPGLVARVEEELQAGHYGIGIGATDSEARERVRSSLSFVGPVRSC